MSRASGMRAECGQYWSEWCLDAGEVGRRNLLKNGKTCRMGILLSGVLLGPAVQLGMREICSTRVGDAISAKGGCFGCFPCHFSDFSDAISAQVRQKVL